jgi:starvation-inducible DNA-binding protein
MLVSTRDPVSDPRDVVVSADGDAQLRKTIAVLEELLAQTIGLRNLYRNARWQTADIQYGRLRQLFDHHYQEQLRLVDILIERIRTLGGERQIFASNFLQGTQFACALRGNKTASRLLSELLDAHESVLTTGRPNGSAMYDQWAHDFAVGQVVCINDAQSLSIRDNLAHVEPKQGFLRRHASALMDYE